MAKIGLIAPFEGVYRQEGYDALAAMRAALAEGPETTVDVLPLALDSSRDVARTARKVLADPSVAAVIGPYWAGEGQELGALVQGESWRHPYAPAGDGAWPAEALALAAEWAGQDGRALVLAGVTDDWARDAGPPIVSVEDVAADQAVLWLGDPAAGAQFADALWARRPGVPFGIYGGGMTTVQNRLGTDAGGPLFLLTWIDDDYARRQERQTPHTPAAYAVYRLTLDTLAELAGERPTTIWQPAIFILTDGELRLAFKP